MKKLTSLLLMVLMGVMAYAATETFDFVNNEDFLTWGSSYTSHTFAGTVANVEFASANKQTGTITDCPVTKGGNVTVTLNDPDAYVITGVSIELRQWGTKAQTVTLYVSDDGGATFSKTDYSSSNFSLDADDLEANALQFRFSSQQNQVGVASIEITYEEASTPVVLPAKPTITCNETYTEGDLIVVTITNNEENAVVYYALDEGAYASFTGSAYDVVAPNDLGDHTIKAYAVLNQVESKVTTATYTVKAAATSYTSLAQVNASEDGEFTFSGEAVFIAGTNKDKNNNYYIVDQDNSVGTLVFSTTTLGQSYTLGDVIPAGWGGTKTLYKGAPEVTSPTGFGPSTTSVDLLPFEATPADVKLENFGRYAVIRGAVLTAGTKTNYYTISVGEESATVFTGTFGKKPDDLSLTYDVIGVIGYYDGPQFLPLEINQAGGNKRPDILINGENPEGKTYLLTELPLTLTIHSNNGNDPAYFHYTFGSDIAGVSSPISASASLDLGSSSALNLKEGSNTIIVAECILVDDAWISLSPSSTATFTVEAQSVATPIIEVGEQYYEGDEVNIVITNSAAGATVHYTVDNEAGEFTDASKTIAGPSIIGTHAVEAWAVLDEIESEHVIATYSVVARPTEAPSIDPFAIAGVYKLVESDNDLEEDGQYIIVSSTQNVAMNNDYNTNTKYFGQTAVTITDNKVTVTDNDNIQAFKLKYVVGVTGGNCYLFNQEGIVLGATAVKGLALGNAEAQNAASVEIDDDANATIAFGDYGRILYNVNSPRFLNYTSNTSASMLLPQLYKLTGEEPVETVATPTIEVGEQYYEGDEVTIVITNNAAGATVHYTVDNEAGEFTEASKTIAGPSIIGEHTVVAWAVLDELESERAMATYSVIARPEPVEGVDYELAYEPSEGTFVIAASNVYALMGAIAGGKADAVKTGFEVADNIITVSTEDVVPVEIKAADTGYNILVGDEYLSAGTSGTNISLSATACEWNIEIDANGIATIKTVTQGNTQRQLLFKTDTDKLGNYASSNVEGADYCTVSLYKLVEEPAETVTLAEALAGDENVEVAIEDNLVAVKVLGYRVFTTNGEDWVVVDLTNTDLAVEEGQTLTNVKGVINGLQTLPTIMASDAEVIVEDEIPYVIEEFDLAYAFEMPKPAQVCEFVGYYFDGKLRGWHTNTGQSLDLVGDYDLNDKEGEQIKVVVGVQYKEVDPTGAPRHIISTEDNAFQRLEAIFIEGGEATAVEAINGKAAVESVRYFNVAGQESAKPFNGVNIVVTRMSDGSIQTTKVIR